LEAYSETFYPAQFGGSALFSLRRGGVKYIEAPRPELYDLRQDPQELSNRIGESPTLAKELKTLLSETTARFTDKSKTSESKLSMSSEELRKLATLGYVGRASLPNKSANSASAPTVPSVSDPKDNLKQFALLSETSQNAATGKCEEASQTLSKVSQEGSALLTAYFMVGRCFFNQQKFSQAYPSFRQLLKLSPSGTSEHLEAQFYVAACDFYLKRIKESKAGFELVLSVNPDHVFAHKYLGLVHLALGEQSEALQEFQYVATRSPQVGS
jgi:tetratricopeptide (TPR) repeat protein